MDTIQYDLIEVYQNLFIVDIIDDYDLGMVFLRTQEYQESPYENINHSSFSIWELIKTYTLSSSKLTFDYMKWGGFNISKTVIESCSATIPEGDRNIYDVTMSNIYNEIQGTLTDKSEQWYIMGVKKFDTMTLKHEICHGFYTLDSTYKASADNIIQTIPPKLYDKMEKVLVSEMYGLNVINDEIQAYLSTDPESLNNMKLNNSQKAKYVEIKRKFQSLYKTYIEPKLSTLPEPRFKNRKDNRRYKRKLRQLKLI